jgi:signal transduction histidine kinase
MRRRKTAIFFLILGICLIVLAVALNVGWILLNLREVALLVFGIVFFALIITGLVLNTIFLLREIRRNEQHDAFLNSVTHELKTPIASIKLYLETLRTRDVDEAKKREFYDVMLSDSNRLLNTVEQVLHASRTRENKRLLNISDIDLAKLLEESIEIVQSRNKLDPAAIRFAEPAASILVSGDRAELHTAFTNVLENAVKYSIDAPKISVRIKNSRPNLVEVFIKDNGIGIPPAELKRIFKRFYRVTGQTTSDTKGTGLGLSIVKAIIERHGGKIRAESKGEEKGSTFVVQLPKE